MSSYVLDQLKRVKEVLPENYTSRQLLATLDTLIFRAIRPIIAESTYVDRVLGILSGWLSTASRRKISSVESKEKFQSLVMAFTIAQTPAERFQIWRALKLERTISFFIITQWLRILEPWVAAQCRGDFAQCMRLERRACIRNNQALFQRQQSVMFWQKQALDFKEALLQKYMRKVVLESSAYYEGHRKNNPHLVIDLDDVGQNFMLAVSKAIDKCDTDKGTLTSYVQLWLKDAASSSHNSHEYGTAFSIPVGKRREIARTENHALNNISVNIDAEEVLELPSGQNVEQDSIRQSSIDRVRMLAKAVDIHGLGRLALGITEVLTPQQMAQLLTCTDTPYSAKL